MANKFLSNVLYIDLSKKFYHIKKRPELFSKFLGGAGVAIQLMNENIQKDVDPLDEGNVIVLAVGPLTPFFPLACKTAAMFKSPLTGNLGESHCGGRTAVAIRMAGFGAIVIKGKSSYPIYLDIFNDSIKFKAASMLWGMKKESTATRIIRNNTKKGKGVRSIMRIGLAGENMVAYGSVTAETFRHFGRLGLGAVFGSKNLKAICIAGDNAYTIEKKSDYRNIYDKIYNIAARSEVMKKYHDLGTPVNILNLNKIKGLPTKNMQKGFSEFADELSGENIAEKYLGKRRACAHCPVGCIHVAALRVQHEEQKYFFKTSMIGYDYELIFSLGTMLEITNSFDLLRLIEEVEQVGVDAMSIGVVLAWATEAFEKGLISEKETDGIKICWGDASVYLKMIGHIARCKNDFYTALGKGVDYAASVYGGEDFAMAYGKQEMPGYTTGPANFIGCLIGSRHCHLDNGGYGLDQTEFIKQGKVTMAAEKITDVLVKEEAWRQILSSLHVCFFARGVFTPEIVQEALSSVGIKISIEDLHKRGLDIYKQKYKFKTENGFSLDGIRIPARTFEKGITPVDGWDEKFVRDALARAKELLS